MSEPIPISTRVNGEPVRAFVEPRLSLVDMLRHHLRLTGSHVGCEMGACGACLMMLDGEVVHGCLTLAVQANGREVRTIEGLAESGEIGDLQEAFHAHNALQCGYCTPGQICSALGLASEGRARSRAEIREGMSGNLCRCGAYGNILDAVEDALPLLDRDGQGGQRA